MQGAILPTAAERSEQIADDLGTVAQVPVGAGSHMPFTAIASAEPLSFTSDRRMQFRTRTRPTTGRGTACAKCGPWVVLGLRRASSNLAQQCPRGLLSYELIFPTALLDTDPGGSPPVQAPPLDTARALAEYRYLTIRDGTEDIRSGIEALASEDLDLLADPALSQQLIDLLREKSRLEAQIARRVSRADHRGVALGDGAATLAAWLRAHAGLGEGEAHSLVRCASSLEAMPATADAFEAGEIGTTKMRLLTAARAPGYEAPLAEVETALVEVARVGTMRDLRCALSYWRSHLDGDGGNEAAERLYQRRGLWASHTLDGNVAVRGDLEPEGGELLIAALAAYTQTPAADDSRSPAQRRADALTDLCRLALDGRLPGGSTRPHLSVIIDADTFAAAAARSASAAAHTDAPPARSLRRLDLDLGGICELEYHGPMVPAAAVRLACDAALTRVVLGPDGTLIDVGRTTRTAPSGLRRALAARDRGCRFPGCDRPLAWCHLHHVVHWLRGGDTAHHNLVHLCGHHHHLVHEGGWTATFDGTILVIYRPDGTPLTGPASPSAP